MNRRPAITTIGFADFASRENRQTLRAPNANPFPNYRTVKMAGAE
jgi:hypothetical protein